MVPNISLYLNKKSPPYINPHFLLKSQIQPGRGCTPANSAGRGRGRKSRTVGPAWATEREILSQTEIEHGDGRGEEEKRASKEEGKVEEGERGLGRHPAV